MSETEPAISEHHLSVKRTARYCTLGGGASVRSLWVVCHGFGQLARAFLGEFAGIARPERLIVAPEALNRFYLNRDGGRAGASAQVGATWMTREDRLAEIDDYVHYLDAVHRDVRKGFTNGVHVTALGFSQGTATVARWLVHGETQIDRVILWAGLLPPEIEPDGAARDRLASADLHLVRGSRDEMVDTEAVRALGHALDRARVPCKVLEFDGGHRLDRATLKVIGGQE